MKNYQSLYDVDVELDKFTVIVGPSSSGKSALIRSIKTLVSNPRTSSFVSKGEKFSTVSLTNDSGKIILEKGDGHSSYEVIVQGESEKFTKLGGSVPAKVTDTLGVKPVESGKQHLNFASQLDKPYLLDETGSTVARVFGELTNVNRIFEAVREANKNKQGLSSLIKTRTSDVSRLEEQKDEFSTLPSRLDSLGEAEVLLSSCHKINDDFTRLQSLLSDLSLAESVLERSVESSYEVPSLDPVLKARDTLSSFTSLVSEVRQTTTKVRELMSSSEESETIISLKQAEVNNILQECGECPTCGQVIESPH